MKEFLEKALLYSVLTIEAVVIISVSMTIPWMLLWNFAMPKLFGLATINFWQALGLAVSSCILMIVFPDDATRIEGEIFFRGLRGSSSK